MRRHSEEMRRLILRRRAYENAHIDSAFERSAALLPVAHGQQRFATILRFRATLSPRYAVLLFRRSSFSALLLLLYTIICAHTRILLPAFTHAASSRRHAPIIYHFVAYPCSIVSTRRPLHALAGSTIANESLLYLFLLLKYMTMRLRARLCSYAAISIISTIYRFPPILAIARSPPLRHFPMCASQEMPE